MREDRQAEVGVTQCSHGVQALRERVHHHCTRTEFRDAIRAPQQGFHRARDIRGIADPVRQDSGNGTHTFLQWTPLWIAEQLVVLDEVGAARAQSCGR